MNGNNEGEKATGRGRRGTLFVFYVMMEYNKGSSCFPTQDGFAHFTVNCTVVYETGRRRFANVIQTQ